MARSCGANTVIRIEKDDIRTVHIVTHLFPPVTALFSPGNGDIMEPPDYRPDWKAFNRRNRWWMRQTLQGIDENGIQMSPPRIVQIVAMPTVGASIVIGIVVPTDAE